MSQRLLCVCRCSPGRRLQKTFPLAVRKALRGNSSLPGRSRVHSQLGTPRPAGFSPRHILVDIGELFIERGLVTREQLVSASNEAAGRRIDCVLVETGLVNEEDALKALADALGLTFVDLQHVEVDRSILSKFPTSA